MGGVGSCVASKISLSIEISTMLGRFLNWLRITTVGKSSLTCLSGGEVESDELDARLISHAVPHSDRTSLHRLRVQERIAERSLDPLRLICARVPGGFAICLNAWVAALLEELCRSSGAPKLGSMIASKCKVTLSMNKNDDNV